MANEIKSKFVDASNTHEALINVPHDSFKFKITIEKYGDREDIETLQVEVFQNGSVHDNILSFDFIERLEDVNSKIFATFSLAVNMGFTPPFLLKKTN